MSTNQQCIQRLTIKAIVRSAIVPLFVSLFLGILGASLLPTTHIAHAQDKPSPVPTIPEAIPTSQPEDNPTSAPSTTSPDSYCQVFADVNAYPAPDYFYLPVEFMASVGYVSGYQNGYFYPYSDITRAQTVKIVTSMEQDFWGSLPSPTTQSFADVPLGSTFSTYVEAAYNPPGGRTRLITGYPCGGSGEPCDQLNRPYFRPNNPVTRGQAVKMIVIAVGWQINTSAPPHFADVPTNQTFFQWIETAANTTSDNPIISGYPCGGSGEPCDQYNRPYFRPNSSVKRGQLAKIDYMAVNFNRSLYIGHDNHSIGGQGGEAYAASNNVSCSSPDPNNSYICGSYVAMATPAVYHQQQYAASEHEVVAGEGTEIDDVAWDSAGVSWIQNNNNSNIYKLAMVFHAGKYFSSSGQCDDGEYGVHGSNLPGYDPNYDETKNGDCTTGDQNELRMYMMNPANLLANTYVYWAYATWYSASGLPVVLDVSNYWVDTSAVGPPEGAGPSYHTPIVRDSMIRFCFQSLDPFIYGGRCPECTGP